MSNKEILEISRVEISFRIDENSKEKLIIKSIELGANLSDVVRTILEHDNILKLPNKDIKNQIDKVSGKHILNNKINVKINMQRYKYLIDKSMELKISLSSLMRIILVHDNTVIMDNNYLDNCISQLYPFGHLINQIAHQLNSDSLKSIIGNKSYESANSRLGVAKRLSNRILDLLKFYPQNVDTNNKVVLTNKNNFRTWIAGIYPITNNIHQISRRLHWDFESKIISEEIFKSVLERLKLINNTVKYYLDAINFIIKN